MVCGAGRRGEATSGAVGLATVERGRPALDQLGDQAADPLEAVADRQPLLRAGVDALEDRRDLVEGEADVPGQVVDVPANGLGVPLRLSEGAGVSIVDLTLQYNPQWLTVSGADLAAGLPAGAAVTLDASTPGSAVLHFSSPTALPTGKKEGSGVVSAPKG